MFTTNAIDQLRSTLAVDLLAFAPELLVSLSIVAMLVLRLMPRLGIHSSMVAFLFGGLALILSALHLYDFTVKLSGTSTPLNLLGTIDPRTWNHFANLIVIDHLTAFLRVVLLGFAMFMIWLASATGIADEEDGADYYTLIMGGTLGMMLMGSANHLLMVFIAIEMASLPCYALAGFLKGRRQSSEASLKYVVYGGGASGVMLYGISLVAGRFGTGYLPDLALAIQEQARVGGGTLGGLETSVVLGLTFILAGLGFKLSAVPFHFWAPDVFEGAAAEVGAFLSVASKAAALVITGRLLLTLTTTADFRNAIPDLQRGLALAVAVFATITATFGNLAAYPQTNLKRLLAYSTIAHAGYMLMGLAAVNSAGMGAVLFYLVAYLLMNLGAFAVVAFLRNATGSEDLRDFRGLIRRSPMAVILLGVFLLSLLGLPPLAGFAAKFQVFAALFESGKEYTERARATGANPSLGYAMYGLLLIGGINTVISAVYYLKVLKVMILDRPADDLEGSPAEPLRLPAGSMILGSVLAILVLLAGVFWNEISEASDLGASDFTPRSVGVLPSGAVGPNVAPPVNFPRPPGG